MTFLKIDKKSEDDNQIKDEPDASVRHFESSGIFPSSTQIVGVLVRIFSGDNHVRFLQEAIHQAVKAQYALEFKTKGLAGGLHCFMGGHCVFRRPRKDIGLQKK